MHTALDAKTAKPAVRAREKAASMPASEVVATVTAVLGPRLTAAIADIKDTRTLRSWQQTGQVPHVAKLRLQAALVSIILLEAEYQRDEVAAWFTWLNDELSDRSPAAVLRKAQTDDEVEQTARAVLSAARAHLAK